MDGRMDLQSFRNASVFPKFAVLSKCVFAYCRQPHPIITHKEQKVNRDLLCAFFSRKNMHASCPTPTPRVFRPKVFCMSTCGSQFFVLSVELRNWPKFTQFTRRHACELL